MGRPLKIKTPEEMEQKWEEFKKDCNNQQVLVHDFSSKNSEFVSERLTKPITYTIEGFCVFIGVPRSVYYDIYSKKKKFKDIVTRIREECEVDARSKFETGVIPTQLAGLWMSKYGYSTKQEVKDETAQSKSISNIENLVNQMNKVDENDIAK